MILRRPSARPWINASTWSTCVTVAARACYQALLVFLWDIFLWLLVVAFCRSLNYSSQTISLYQPNGRHNNSEVRDLQFWWDLYPNGHEFICCSWCKNKACSSHNNTTNWSWNNASFSRFERRFFCAGWIPTQIKTFLFLPKIDDLRHCQLPYNL